MTAEHSKRASTSKTAKQLISGVIKNKIINLVRASVGCGASAIDEEN